MAIRRSQIKNCPYNPRVIDAHARKKLKGGIKALGLVEPLVWNERSGNAVGGNQRLGILDDLSTDTEYLIDVARIDVDDKTEKKLVLLLNNQSAQGAWDADLLAGVLQDIGTLEDTGFDKVDVQFLLPDFDPSPLFKDAAETSAADIEAIAAMKARKKVYHDQEQAKDDAEFYIVVVFDSRGDCTDFLKRLNLDEDEKYFSGAKFRTLCGIAEAVPAQ